LIVFWYQEKRIALATSETCTINQVGVKEACHTFVRRTNAVHDFHSTNTPLKSSVHLCTSEKSALLIENKQQ